jgi:hypothetical protein
MHNTHHTPHAGWLLFSGLVLIVISFLALSLAVTATGTARFVVALGYPAAIGYVVGAVFDIAKAVLPIALLMLLTRRAIMSFALIGVAWLGLMTYSSLATHATVGRAIGSIERAGIWKMEVRTNAKVELVTIEQRLATLASPRTPRPPTSVRKALAAEKVPPSVWRRSQECLSIRRSTYFQKACAKVLQLRRELAAAEDYEQLDVRAKELREKLAAAPIVATIDPLPQAFAATIGRLMPLDGRVGVALLLTLVIEIMSCFGLAGLRALREGQKREEDMPRPQIVQGEFLDVPDGRSTRPTKAIPDGSSENIAQSSLRTCGIGIAARQVAGRDGTLRRSSKVVPLGRANGRKACTSKRAQTSVVSAGKGQSLIGSHVRAFAREWLQDAEGLSLSAADLRAAYEAWCAIHGYAPLSQQKLGVALKGLGYAKWKSCGLIRYRDVQLVSVGVARLGEAAIEGRRGKTNADHCSSGQERRIAL